MTGFQDLTEVLDPYLDLPISGKTYRIPAVDAATGLRCQAIVELAVKVKTGENVTPADVASLTLDDDQEHEFTRSMLGDIFDDMRADKVPWTYITRAARTVFAWTVQGIPEAREVWTSRDDLPKARKAPADRRPKAPGTRASTKKPASSRGTSTPRKTTASRGGTS